MYKKSSQSTIFNSKKKKKIQKSKMLELAYNDVYEIH